jgi:hypothetical protein
MVIKKKAAKYFFICFSINLVENKNKKIIIFFITIQINNIFAYLNYKLTLTSHYSQPLTRINLELTLILTPSKRLVRYIIYIYFLNEVYSIFTKTNIVIIKLN